MAIKYLVVALTLLGVVCAQSDPTVSDALDNLPPELQGKVNASDIEAIKNQSALIFKEKCEKNGGASAYERAKKASEQFPNCVKESLGLGDPAVLQREIEQAKPNGTVDEVFKKYCKKTPQVKLCFTNMTEEVKPCFTAEEQKNLKTVYNITEQLAEFICYKDGDRIALFIAEGGPECFQMKQEDIQNCVNTTLGSDYQFNTNNISANVLPEIAFGVKECQKFTDLETCIVSALGDCERPTSANIVEALFKFARQATPCLKTEAKPNSASGLAVTSATIIVALSTLFF